MILFALLLLVIGAYAVTLLACAMAWYKLPRLQAKPPHDAAFFSVIVPVKDEAATILQLLQDLEGQDYPPSNFEVLVIDDHSTDGTPTLVQEFQATSSLNLRVLFLASFPENRLKKGAIAVGVSQAKGDWIACTDGDCRVPAAWLSSINQCRVEQQAKFISGPVAFASDGSWFQQLQALEFSALIGVGAASIGLTLPTMCNGANLAYEKSAFLEVNGFSGNAHLPSGDDEFLMHKIHQRQAGCVAFLKDRNAIVYTKATNSFTSFIEQRKRWASKWKHYTLAAPKALALLVLVGNISLWLALVATVALGFSWSWFLLLVVLKLVADAFLLYQVLGFFQNRKLLLHLGLLQLVYVPYILATAILGWRGTYAWKDRQHVAA